MISKLLCFVAILALLLSGCDALPTPSPEQVWAENTLAGMTVQQKIGQMLLVGIDGTAYTEEACQYVQALHAGGVTFQAHNVENPEQMQVFTHQLQDCAQAGGGPPLLLSIAHEGEYVNQFKSGATVFPTAMALGAVAVGGPRLAYQVGLAASQELAYSGLNLNLAPVADVLTNLDNEVISLRSFGGDPEKVGELVSATVRGYQESGVLATLKHFPGHGHVAEDSHVTLPVDPSTREQMDAEHLPPFEAGIEAGAQVVMLSHLAYPGLTGDDSPAPFSPEISRLLREDLGFRGIILSDSLRMKAVSGKQRSIMRAGLDSIAAGVDMLLLNDPAQAQATYDFLIDAYNEKKLTDERINAAALSILTVKAQLALYPPEIPQAEPDWQAHADLAREISMQAVAQLQDQARLLPMRSGQRVLVIGPGANWPYYATLKQAFDERSIQAVFEHYPTPWEGDLSKPDLPAGLSEQAGQFDRVLVFTRDAHLRKVAHTDDFQAGLVNSLLAGGAKVIVVALKSPVDLMEFPSVSTYLATFSTREGALDALTAALLGERTPTGRIPLP